MNDPSNGLFVDADFYRNGSEGPASRLAPDCFDHSLGHAITLVDVSDWLKRCFSARLAAVS